MQTLQSPEKCKLEIGNIDFPSVEENSKKTDYYFRTFKRLTPLLLKHGILDDLFGVLGHGGDDDDDNNNEDNNYDCFQGIIRVIRCINHISQEHTFPDSFLVFYFEFSSSTSGMSVSAPDSESEKSRSEPEDDSEAEEFSFCTSGSSI